MIAVTVDQHAPPGRQPGPDRGPTRPQGYRGPVRMARTAPAVLAQPTSLCNLDCTYCYLPDRAVANRMTVEVADAVAAGVREWSREHPVAVLWHGGESLAVGEEYLRRLMDRFGPGGEHPVTHALQTNATLIDQRWCELFASRGVRVGVSLDGPGSANEARVDRRGRRPPTGRSAVWSTCAGRGSTSA